MTGLPRGITHSEIAAVLSRETFAAISIAEQQPAAASNQRDPAQHGNLKVSGKLHGAFNAAVHHEFKQERNCKAQGDTSSKKPNHQFLLQLAAHAQRTRRTLHDTDVWHLGWVQCFIDSCSFRLRSS
jgi:hypothetical protein